MTKVLTMLQFRFDPAENGPPIAKVRQPVITLLDTLGTPMETGEL